MNVWPVGPVQRVSTTLRIDQDLPVNTVMWVKVVNIPGGHYRLLQFIPHLDHVLQDVLKMGIVRNHVLFQERCVIWLRLDFNKVIITSFLQCCRVPLFHHRSKDFPGRAGRSQQQTVPVLTEYGPRNPWYPMEVLNIRK